MKLLHTADLHLGARFRSLGRRGADQRRQLIETFRRIVDLAIVERVDAMVVAGDLFDSNRPSGELIGEVIAQARRLGADGAPLVILPGTHDAADAESVYRRIDFAAEAPTCVVLTPERPTFSLAGGQATLHGVVAATKSIAGNPLADIRRDNAPIQVGVGHGSMAIPNVVETDDVLFRPEDIARSGLHYLALGHWHSFAEHRCGDTLACYAGAPEFVGLDQPGFGSVALVSLEPDGRCAVERRRVGRRRFERIELPIDAAADVGAIRRAIEAKSDPDLALDARLTGLCANDLVIDVLALERDLEARFFALRVRDESHARLADVDLGTLPEATVIGRYVREMRARIDAAADTEERAMIDEALRIGVAALRGQAVFA